MFPVEILKKIRQIEIKTNRLVSDIFSGEYESVFKGQGMEFAEVREYVVGDEVRMIDWNVTARYGHPYVKKFIEERELTVILLVDISFSTHFGSREKSKGEIAAEICALLAFSAIRNNDKVGLIMFSSEVEKFIAPKKGRKHILRVVREVLYTQAQHRGTDINTALQYLARITKRKCIVFLISDLLAEGYETLLNITHQKHDLIVITITDPREREIPPLGLLELENIETGERIIVNTKKKEGREKIKEFTRWREERIKKFFRTSKIDHIEISTDKSYVEPLVSFFKLREKKLGK